MIEQLENNPNAAAGLSWLLENEAVSSPAVLNALILNIFRMVPGVVDIEFVIDSNAKKLLVYLEVTRWTRWFHLKKTELQVRQLLDQVLPSYKKRITSDREILQKAVKLVSGEKSGS